MNKYTSISSSGNQHPVRRAGQETNYLTAPHGKITSALAGINSKYSLEEKTADKHLLRFYHEQTNSTIEIKQKLDKAIRTYGTNDDKIFVILLARFIKNNGFGKGNPNNINCDVVVSIAEIARVLGIDIIPKLIDSGNSVQKATQAEEKRVAVNKKNITRLTRKTILNLKSASINTTENIKGKKEETGFINIFDSGIVRKDGSVVVRFGATMANILVKLPLSKYPENLFKISANCPNAYTMGKYMVEHFCMPSNHKSGVANRLRIKSLLSVTNLPKINDKSVKKHGWVNRIANPFEKNLNILKEFKVLTDYKITYARGAEIQDYQKECLKNYDFWVNECFVEFTLTNEAEIKKDLDVDTQYNKADTQEKEV